MTPSLSQTQRQHFPILSVSRVRKPEPDKSARGTRLKATYSTRAVPMHSACPSTIPTGTSPHCQAPRAPSKPRLEAGETSCIRHRIPQIPGLLYAPQDPPAQLQDPLVQPPDPLAWPQGKPSSCQGWSRPQLCLFLPTWERTGVAAGVPGQAWCRRRAAGQQGRQGCSGAPESPSPAEAEHS